MPDTPLSTADQQLLERFDQLLSKEDLTRATNRVIAWTVGSSLAMVMFVLGVIWFLGVS